MTTLTLEIPSKYTKEKKIIETYLKNSLLDYIEATQDIQLQKDLNQDKEFKDLHDKLSEKIGNL